MPVSDAVGHHNLSLSAHSRLRADQAYLISLIHNVRSYRSERQLTARLLVPANADGSYYIYQRIVLQLQLCLLICQSCLLRIADCSYQ